MPHTKIQDIIQGAVLAASMAYAPYSGYNVGAALRAKDGTVYTGCNVENAAYPACMCAERTAVYKAVSEGRREFDLIVVATENGGSPCGICRQVLFEFAPEMQVIMVDLNGKICEDTTLRQLLPHGFGPSSLPGTKSQNGVDKTE
jgi:cytidine deaminase